MILLQKWNVLHDNRLWFFRMNLMKFFRFASNQISSVTSYVQPCKSHTNEIMIVLFWYNQECCSALNSILKLEIHACSNPSLLFPTIVSTWSITGYINTERRLTSSDITFTCSRHVNYGNTINVFLFFRKKGVKYLKFCTFNYRTIKL